MDEPLWCACILQHAAAAAARAPHRPLVRWRRLACLFLLLLLLPPPLNLFWRQLWRRWRGHTPHKLEHCALHAQFLKLINFSVRLVRQAGAGRNNYFSQFVSSSPDPLQNYFSIRLAASELFNKRTGHKRTVFNSN